MGERLFQLYRSIVAAFWAPITSLFFFFFPEPEVREGDTEEQAARRVRDAVWSGRIRRIAMIALGMLMLGGGFALKTLGVFCAESFELTMLGRIVITLGGVLSLPMTSVTALSIGVLVLWIAIAIGLIQIPVGKAMEVMRELGQMLRVLDPIQRHGEGSIQLINVQKLLRWSMLLLLIPAFDLMSTVWLGAIPDWHVYAMLLLITGGGLVVGMIAAARGRKIGAGLDLLLGMNGYLVVGGIITLLAALAIEMRHLLPMEVVKYAGDAFVPIVCVVAAALHIVTIVALWRMLRKPPEHEQAAAGGAMLGTVGGRGGTALRVLAGVAVLVILCGAGVVAVAMNWDAIRGREPEQRTATTYAPQTASPPTTVVVEAAPGDRAEPPMAPPVPPERSDAQRIAAYFAENRATCPQTAAENTWRRLPGARAACEIEANRRDHPTIFARAGR